jgi:hypothetical protein
LTGRLRRRPFSAGIECSQEVSKPIDRFMNALNS